ncbi:MAG TPA: L-histidine N(alpha)-methyltransferase [Candidatus Nanoarchaeia archaeon]|nr:L-histidine N(alpha)-methyltransferase [Candidatus Nanoarchaeia archaeon]
MPSFIKDKIKESLIIYQKYSDLYKKYNEHKLLQFQLNEFISKLPKKARVLDAGCGTGRDAKYLQEEGLEVLAVDVSEEMLKEAKEKNLKTKQLDLTKEKTEEKFQGIWCMALISELSNEEAQKVINNFQEMLDDRGILYLSMKYGQGIKEQEDPRYNNIKRIFQLYDEEKTKKLLSNFKILKLMKSEGWLEVIATLNP